MRTESRQMDPLAVKVKQRTPHILLCVMVAMHVEWILSCIITESLGKHVSFSVILEAQKQCAFGAEHQFEMIWVLDCCSHLSKSRSPPPHNSISIMLLQNLQRTDITLSVLRLRLCPATPVEFVVSVAGVMVSRMTSLLGSFSLLYLIVVSRNHVFN